LGAAHGDAVAGVRVPLFDGADARDAFRELGMLAQEFPFECIALLSSHRGDVERKGLSACSPTLA